MLTELAAKKAKGADAPYKLSDSGGLFLLVTPAGGKLWRQKYRFAGKEKVLAFGPYPQVSLLEAREKREAAKKLLRENIDPGVERKSKKIAGAMAAGVTFEAAARSWHSLNAASWTERHREDVLDSLERLVFPTLGSMPLASITAPVVLGVLRPIEQRPALETARRVRQRMSAVFVYGIASGLCEADPAAVVQKAMAPMKKGRQPAITTLDGAREIIRKVDESAAHPLTRLAMRLLALTALRPGTLMTTPWAELNGLPDLEPTWEVPADRLKLLKLHKDDEEKNHLVPLSKQAIDTINAARTISGRGPFCFPNSRHAHKPMSENAIGYMLNRAGFHHKHVPHGWRATFSSVMNELYPNDHRIIDMMLAHTPKDKVEGAYNRATHLARRRELAQEWADLLLKDAMPASEIVALPRRYNKAPN